MALTRCDSAMVEIEMAKIVIMTQERHIISIYVRFYEHNHNLLNDFHNYDLMMISMVMMLLMVIIIIVDSWLFVLVD